MLQRYTPAKDTAVKIKKIAGTSFRDKELLGIRLAKTGLTRHRLEEIFKQQYGISLSEYIKLLRLNEIKHMLSCTNKEIIDTTYGTGFGSLSAFYRFVKQNTGQTPYAYRKKRKGAK